MHSEYFSDKFFVTGCSVQSRKTHREGQKSERDFDVVVDILGFSNLGRISLADAFWLLQQEGSSPSRWGRRLQLI